MKLFPEPFHVVSLTKKLSCPLLVRRNMIKNSMYERTISFVGDVVFRPKWERDGTVE